MKFLKVLTVFTLVISLTLFACKKERVCECTTKVDGFPDQVEKTTMVDVTKRTAKDACVSRKGEVNGISATQTCELK